MYCLYSCADGKASTCASRGCGSAIHKIAFNLTAFMLFKIFAIFFLHQGMLALEKFGLVIDTFNLLSRVIRALSFFHCFDQNILNQCYLWIATLSDEFLIFSESGHNLFLWRNLVYLNVSQNQFLSQMNVLITLF